MKNVLLIYLNLKNNKPKYVLVDYNTLVQEGQTEAVVADQASVNEVASSIFSRHLEAFKELTECSD